MKRFHKLILAACMLLAVACNNRYFPVRELRFDGMKGNVESTKTSYFRAYKHFGEIVKDEDDMYLVTRQKFDEDGFMIENIHYNRYGEEIYEGYSTYCDGYMSEFIEINSNGKHKGEIKGKRIELRNNYAKWEYEGMGFRYGELTYDNTIVNGKLYHQTITNENGVIVMDKLIHKNGIVVSQTNYDNEGNLLFEEINELNSDNLVIRTLREFDNRVESHTEMFEYEYTDFDEYGNWRKRVAKSDEYVYIHEREINYR